MYCHPKYYEPLPNLLYHEGMEHSAMFSWRSGIATPPRAWVYVADYDGDGFLDVFVVMDAVRISCFVTTSHGAFEERAVEAAWPIMTMRRAISSMGGGFSRLRCHAGGEDIFVTARTETYPLFETWTAVLSPT